MNTSPFASGFVPTLLAAGLSLATAGALPAAPTATPLDARVNLNGAKQSGPGRLFVIAGEPSSVNTIQEPTKVAPKEEPLADAAASLTRTFPAHSVTLLRFPAKP